ncbi:hypothetical protein DOTSEDRAFT_123052 [Lecanosticta acicola]|uniref:DUF1275 domain protein n=1 Tax=Lecanosticta acicola TaxID=111012 RepID=A0AAI9ED64_9PEZI|nr:hypothetical protein DOTSEDRAFT_123052 [Lecanosticta acicola]
MPVPGGHGDSAAVGGKPGNLADDGSLEKGGGGGGGGGGGSKAAGIIFSKARIFEAVEKDRGDLALLACCFVTGLVDAAVFSNWGLFVGMQTGNTVILGLSASGLPDNPHAWLTTLVSIACFLIGAFLTFRLSKILTPNGPASNRLWCGMLFFLQGLLILVAAALSTPQGLIPQNPGHTNRYTPASISVKDNIRIVSLIPPLAFQAGMQIASSRLLGFNELPVNVLTSTYCDIMGDFQLLALNNVKRNRRVAAAVLLLAGAICSGWMMRSAGGLMSVFWLGGGVKVLTGVVMWCCMPAAAAAKS